MLNHQDGKCAICKSDDPHNHYGVFHVDHDHKTGLIRGLLCQRCNHLLGCANDDTLILLRAVQYLRRNDNLWSFHADDVCPGRVTSLTLSQRKGGYYIVQWCDRRTGKRKTKALKTRDREVAERRRAVLFEFLNGATLPQVRSQHQAEDYK